MRVEAWPFSAGRGAAGRFRGALMRQPIIPPILARLHLLGRAVGVNVGDGPFRRNL